jgi:hypothetical protein
MALVRWTINVNLRAVLQLSRVGGLLFNYAASGEQHVELRRANNPAMGCRFDDDERGLRRDALIHRPSALSLDRLLHP